MPKSHTTPAPSMFFVLVCLSVMVVTAVKIWNQSAQLSPSIQVAQRTANAVQTTNAVRTEAVQATNAVPTMTATPVPPTAPIQVPHVPRYGAEIRAEVVLAPPPSTNASPISATALEAEHATLDTALLVGPKDVFVPLDRPTELDAMATSHGLENPPQVLLPPLRPEAEFAADVATPALDRVAVNLPSATPGIAPNITPPTAVVAPRAPVEIAAPAIEMPSVEVRNVEVRNVEVPSAEVPTVEVPDVAVPEITIPNIPATTDANTLAIDNEDPPLPAPPVLSIEPAPTDVVAAPLAETVIIAPELPAAPEAFTTTVETSEAEVNEEKEDETSDPAATEEDDHARDAIQAARIAAHNKRKRANKRTAATETKTVWPAPQALLKDLQQLQEYRVQAGTEAIVEWAAEIETAISELGQSRGIATIDAVQPTRKLHYLVENTPRVDNSTLQSRVMVARYAVQRRLAVWNRVQVAMQPNVDEQIANVQSNVDDELVVSLTRTIRRAFGDGKEAKNWIRFLLLDGIEGLAMSADSRGSVERAILASQLLERMNREQLAPAQVAVLDSPVAKQLQSQLRIWSTAKMDYPRLLAAIERMESNPSFGKSNHLSELAAQLKWSHAPEQNEIASTFYSHYRNANARMAVTELLLNRMLPIVRDSQTPIREEILGARVFGNSASWTKIGLDLVPDNQRLRMKLIANGNVNTQTRSFKGPAVVFNRNQSQFSLQKMITCDQGGLHIGKSTTTASTKLSVLGLRTDYDGIPLFGSIARRKVKEQVNQQRSLAKRIINNRVANQAETMVDSKLTQQLVETQRNLEEKLIQPLRQLQLDPTTVSLQTTEERIVYRGRLAAEHHLAAFTPRPNALANSVVSLQLHESAINNAIERLRVDGKRGDLREMLEAAANSRPSMKFKVPDDVPQGVTLELASEDAIRMRWHNGAMRISIRVAELAFKRRSWSNFTVSANYRPEVKGLDAELFRDGVVELKGAKRISMRDQVILRGVFGKVFSKNRNIPLMAKKLAEDRRLADLHITQFVIRDGWLGVSVGRNAQSVARQRGRNNYRR